MLALIIDKDERILVMHQVEGVKALHWLVPIQAITVADVESNTIGRNREFAANMLAQLDEAADTPTVETYQTKVQDMKRELEEMHLLHSSLFGASQDDVKALIVTAYETVSAISCSNFDQ